MSPTPPRTGSARRRPRIAVVAASAAVLAGTALTFAGTAEAAAGCRVTYKVTNQWPTGFGAAIDLTNLGDRLDNWTLTFAFPSGQTITQLWNGTHTQSGSQVTVRNAGHNGVLATNTTTSFGFNGSWTGANATPTSFALNGTACTGGVTAPPVSSSAPPVSNPPVSQPPVSQPPSSGCNVAPVDPQATAAARRLLCYVYSQYGNHILSGQQESTWINGPDHEINYIYRNTGKYPAIRGLDMGDSPTFGSRAAAWWNAGGIPMVGYHMGSPAQDSDGYAGSQMNANINAALTAGTADNRRLLQRLDAVSAQLKLVGDAGGAVIWRPYHEAGGTWFWWSKEGGAAYNRLWQYTFTYMTRTKGLHHLVWLHPFNGEPQSSFHPGKQYVDIGGADTYASDRNPLTTLFTRTRTIVGNTVPIALHENGRIPDPNQLQSSSAKWVLFNTWHSSFIEPTTNPVSVFQQVYSHSYVITRDELPNLK